MADAVAMVLVFSLRSFVLDLDSTRMLLVART